MNKRSYYTMPRNENQLIKPFYTEEWAVITDDVVPYVLPDAYYISTYGRVWSVKCHKIMAKHPGVRGYMQCMLYGTHGKNICMRVDRGVLMTFNPISNMHTMQANHRNMDITDDHIWNLEWCTGTENTALADMNGSRYQTDPEYDKNIDPYILDCIAQEIRAKQISQTKIAKKYKVSIDVVEGISMGKTHRDLYEKYRLWEVKFQRPHVSEISVEQLHQMCQFAIANPYDKNIYGTKRNYYIEAFNAVGCQKTKETMTDSNCNLVRKLIDGKIYLDISSGYDLTEARAKLNS